MLTTKADDRWSMARDAPWRRRQRKESLIESLLPSPIPSSVVFQPRNSEDETSKSVEANCVRYWLGRSHTARTTQSN